VFRIDKNKIAFFAMDGSLLFELENPGSEILRADYYDLPKGNKVFSLFDPTQNYSHLYNEKGVSLTSYPVESTLPVVVDYNAKSQEVKACVVANKTVQFLSLTELVKAH
jgi:hypothetical protein